MTHPFWDKMFQDEAYRYGKEPNAFLVTQAANLPEGAHVLCVGDGEGRNGVWLAQRGFQVTSVEPSQVGCRKIEALAQERGVQVEVIQAALPAHALPVAHYDAAALIYLHLPPAIRARAHAQIAQALRPGGTLILEAFTPAQRQGGYTSGGPQDEAMLYTEAMLRQDLQGLRVTHCVEHEVELREGPGHSGPAQVVDLVASA